MTNEYSDNIEGQWSELWNLPEESTLEVDEMQLIFEERRQHRRWRTYLEYVGLFLGFVLTLGFLLSSFSVSTVVLALFCWMVWGIGIWGSRASARSAREVQTQAPADFVKTMREYGEQRQRDLSLARYLLVAVGVFCGVWTIWIMSENWDAYVQEPWRGVVGVGGVIFFYLLAIFLHRKEVARVEEEVVSLEEVERELVMDEDRVR